MRTLIPLALLASSLPLPAAILAQTASTSAPALPAAILAQTASTSAPALPDAPSVAPSAGGNPLPIINGRHYRPPSNDENLHVLKRRLFGFGALGGPAFTAAWQMARDRPDIRYWPEGAEGYFKRYGAAYGERAIQAGTRYTLGAAFHEDNRYLLCHGCTLKQKIVNSVLADVSARHGADGHRTFSPTGILAGFSGPLVAYAYWYPNQDPNYTLTRGARNSLTGFGTRPAAHLAFELFDGYRIPFTHRHIGDNRPTIPEQVPAGFTGPLPSKLRNDPRLPDPAGTYAEVAPAASASARLTH